MQESHSPPRPENWPPETKRCADTSDMFQEEKPEKKAQQQEEIER